MNLLFFLISLTLSDLYHISPGEAQDLLVIKALVPSVYLPKPQIQPFSIPIPKAERTHIAISDDDVVVDFSNGYSFAITPKLSKGKATNEVVPFEMESMELGCSFIYPRIHRLFRQSSFIIHGNIGTVTITIPGRIISSPRMDKKMLSPILGERWASVCKVESFCSRFRETEHQNICIREFRMDNHDTYIDFSIPSGYRKVICEGNGKYQFFYEKKDVIEVFVDTQRETVIEEISFWNGFDEYNRQIWSKRTGPLLFVLRTSDQNREQFMRATRLLEKPK